MSKKETAKPEIPQKLPQTSPKKPPEEDKDAGKFLTDDSQPIIKKIFGIILLVAIPIVLSIICLMLRIGITTNIRPSSPPQDSKPPICAGMNSASVQPSLEGEPIIVGKDCLSAKINPPNRVGYKILVHFSEKDNASYYLDDNGKLTGPFLSPPNTSKEFDFSRHPFRMMGFDGAATIHLL